MKKIIYVLFIFCFGSLYAQEPQFLPTASCDGAIQIEAARGVIERTAPGSSQWFLLKIIEPKGGVEHGHNSVLDNEKQNEAGGSFSIRLNNKKIEISGTDGVALCSGFNYYLKYIAKLSISWDAATVELPTPPLFPTQPIEKISLYQWRYYMNYCTFGYSTPFWGKERWRQEVDWMALHGINMPLALTGQEAIWRELYLEMGLSDEDLDPFFTGPAFLPWFWMRNLDRWGGSLPPWWMGRQKELQRYILTAERSLGMKPVLPAFNGHVPEALSKVLSNAKLLKDGGWCGFEGNWMVAPDDELFAQLGTAFLKKQTEIYGTDHLYSADIYNENNPQKTTKSFLTSVAKKVYASMSAVDSDAIWVMQGWIYVNDPHFWTKRRSKQFLDAIPDDKLIMLDLFSTAKPAWDKRDAFNGKQWIYCQLHNWGGKQGMYGRLDKMGSEPISLVAKRAQGDSAVGNFSGIGLSPEGIETNPVVYDFFADLVWSDSAIDPDTWVQSYSKRRYGEGSGASQEAWSILMEELYQCPTLRHGPQGSLFCMRPSLSTGGSFVRAEIWYDTGKLREAFKLLLSDYETFKHNSRYRYDLVDLGRQLLSDYSQVLHLEMKKAIMEKDSVKLKAVAEKWENAMMLNDSILAEHPEFTVGRWLAHAQQAGEEASLYAYQSVADGIEVEGTLSPVQWTQFNARNLITLWGPETSTLHDYAQRQYSGLMKDFYLPRWELFFEMQIEAIESGKAMSQSHFEKRCSKAEYLWSLDEKKYSVDSAGELSLIAGELVELLLIQ